jgi:hypothetical protein
MRDFDAWERHQADLFYADLMGTRRTRRRWAALPAEGGVRFVERMPEAAPPEMEDAGQEEAVPLDGRGRFRHAALDGASGDNVEARWNVDAATPAGSTIDVVVHLHGFGSAPAGTDFLAMKAAAAGLDMVDGGTVRVRASRPTLALVPRGRNTGGETWVFDKLADPTAVAALIEAGLTWLGATVLRLPSGSTLARGRLTMMAHSGGGAWLSALLGKGLDPDEVVCFDSLYGGEEPVRRWAEARMASPQAGRSGLRAFYTACGAPSREYPAGRWIERPNRKPLYRPPSPWKYWTSDRKWHLISTEVSARRLHHAMERALSPLAASAALSRRFRVERTSVDHLDIPARYSPRLLDDIAATVPKASSPPPATARPACVDNDDWLKRPRKPGGDDPPPPPPTPPATEDAPFEAENVYAPPDARPYAPSSSAALFRTPPNPVAVTSATQWPESTTDADGASERALRAMGVNAAGIAAYAGAGMTALRPIAAAFGEAALIELLRRLRYPPARLARPPHSFDNDTQLNQAFGKTVPRPVILSMRTLLTIPGHFRELARQAGTDQEAYALENLGWLLMQSLRGEVRTSSGFDFWLPASPVFVTPFANPLPGLSPQATRLVASHRLMDTTINTSEYRARCDAWISGAAGRTWRLETGRETVTGRPVGAPFYSAPFTIPASISIAAPRGQVQAAWDRRVAAFDAGTTTKPLTKCDNTHLAPLHVMAPISLRGLQLRAHFPAPITEPALTTLTGLAVVQPAFEAVFQAVADLGWNDLLFETQGMGCFRGTKIPGRPAAARTMSKHSLGIAIDLNAFENEQNIAGSMDPRIVALFEAFRFRWGKGFRTPDPMHFEYAG